MDQVVALIPARSGSKSIPDKNIRLLAGKPLLAYSIAASQLAHNIGRVIVSTDSQHYANIAQEYGAEVPFLRPKEISCDMSTDYQFIKHALDWFQDNEGWQPEYLVHLRPTTPLRNPRCIDAAIEYMKKSKGATSLRSMHKTHLTPYKMFKLKGGYAEPFLSYKNIKEFYNLPRQMFEDAYIPNGYVDIVKPSIFRKTGLLHGEKMKIWQTDKVADIDVLDDLNFALDILHEERFGDILDHLGKTK